MSLRFPLRLCIDCHDLPHHRVVDPSHCGHGGQDAKVGDCDGCAESKSLIICHADTFIIAADGKSITCMVCRKTSYHPKDVEEKFCGACNIFHEDRFPWLK